MIFEASLLVLYGPSFAVSISTDVALNIHRPLITGAVVD